MEKIKQYFLMGVIWLVSKIGTGIIYVLYWIESLRVKHSYRKMLRFTKKIDKKYGLNTYEIINKEIGVA